MISMKTKDTATEPLKGLEELVSKLNTERLTAEIARRAKERVPVRTGVLRDSIRSFEGVVEATAPYASFIEEGTRFLEARPFLRTSTEDTIEDFLEGRYGGLRFLT